MHLALLLLTGALSLVSAPVFAAESLPANPFIDGDRVVFLGDSITQFGNDPRGYVDVLRTALSAPGHPAVTVINAGISGNTVPDLVARLDADVLRKAPTVVLDRTKAKAVFGQINQARGFRRFSFSGQTKTKTEWILICTTHNLLKLWRSGWRPA